MLKEFSTFGSCSSRNIFNSEINSEYKNFFKINHSVESVNLISLMSDPIEYDEKLLDSGHEYDNICVYEDLSKTYLNFLKNSRIDYLIIDTYFDAIFNVLVLDENKFLTDSLRLKNVSLSKKLKCEKKLSVDNFEEYFEYWKKACDSFFNFINKNNSGIKIILNCSRSVYKYLNDNGDIVESKKLKKKCKYDKFREIMDVYILENYDVEVLSFDKSTLADKNHIFGLHESHYEPKYYQDKTMQLNSIIKRNDEWSNELNAKYRRLSREKLKYDLMDDNYRKLITKLKLMFLKLNI